MLQNQNETTRTFKAREDDDQQEPTRVGTDIDVARDKKTVSSAIWVQMAPRKNWRSLKVVKVVDMFIFVFKDLVDTNFQTARLRRRGRCFIV